MSKDTNYRRLIGSQRWSALARSVKAQAGWTCSKCGRVTRRLAVHHVAPVETATTLREMERLCFDETNLQVLCFDCHAEEHKLMRRTTRESHEERTRSNVDRFFSRYVDGGDEGGERDAQPP